MRFSAQIFFAIGLGDGARDGQSEAGSILFGGEERVENLGNLLVRDTGTGIGDRHLHSRISGQCRSNCASGPRAPAAGGFRWSPNAATPASRILALQIRWAAL